MRQLIFIFLLGFAIKVNAAKITVGKGKAFTTITQAVAAAQAGDTVLVYPGLYREKNLAINKTISLIGINYPVLDGENKYELITVTASGTLISGLKLINSGISSLDEISGIKVIECKNVSIKNNILEDIFFGIYFQGSSYCFVENNKITAHKTQEQESGNGIHCWKSDSLYIIQNEISGHRDGIYFEFVTHSVILRNTSHDNLRYGLHFMFSNDDSYYANLFHNNGAGVSVMYSKKVTMINNIFEQNWGDGSYGLLLKEITDSYVSGNTFQKNTSGIYMEGTTRIEVLKNTFLSNGWAMQIQASCMDNNVNKNNFIANSFDIGTNGTLVLNNFDYNFWDKYEGYDLNKDKIGDIPFHPLSLFSVIVEKQPAAMLLYRSFMITLLDKSEKIFPTLTPENFIDNFPLLKPLAI